MTYTLKDLKHLEVMADLLNANPVEPEQINLTELLSFDKVEHKPTIDEKILTLCSILRSSGFDKQADGLENKFAIYKAANTHMYRAIDEDGEDLVDFAHPEGDKNMGEASDNLGDVETIVSRHKKMVDVVNKMPKGKLASYIDRVKIVLAQANTTTSELDQLYIAASNKLDEFIKSFKKLLEISGTEDNVGDNIYTQYMLAQRKSLSEKHVSSDPEFYGLNRYIEMFKDNEEPSWFSSLQTKNKWKYTILPMLDELQKQIKPYDDDIKNIVKLEQGIQTNDALNKLKGNDTTEAHKDAPKDAPKVDNKPQDVETKIKQSVAKLMSFKAQLNADAKFLKLDDNTKNRVNQWLDDKLKSYNLLSQAYKAHIEAYKDVAEKPQPTRILANLNELDNQLNAFAEKWIS